MKNCQQCGQEMAADSPEGLCPRCLLSLAAKPDDSASAADVNIIDIADPTAVAERLPQFEILSLLGRGGMGVVYRARQRQLDRTVALKILPPADALTPDFVERFRREALSLARLNHPNIVHVHDFGETGGLYYLVMEYVDGINLREMLEARKLTPAEALAIVPHICDALHYAHEEGVVHRDIKPENILLDQRGRVKIADFGLARMLGREHPEDRLTHSGMTVGTPRYMAPEQLDHPETADHRADIYSLGVVFYEMLTGELPMGRFAPPSERVQIDVRFDEIVLRTLERDVERRYQHASEVKAAVENMTSKPAPEPPKTWPQRLREFAMGLLFLPRELPPSIRGRYIWRFSLLTLGWALLLAGCLVVLPMHIVSDGHVTYTPASKAYQSLTLIGENDWYHTIATGPRTIRVDASKMSVQLEVTSLPAEGQKSRTGSLRVELPGLAASQSIPGQKEPRVFMPDAEELTAWLSRELGIDVSKPEVQAEMRQIVSLLKTYQTYAPSSWKAFDETARSRLTAFSVTSLRSGFHSFAPIMGFFFLLIPVYLLAMALLGRAALAERRQEIEAGRWQPPPLLFRDAVLKPTLISLLILALIGGLSAFAAPAVFLRSETFVPLIAMPAAMVFVLCALFWALRRWVLRLQP